MKMFPIAVVLLGVLLVYGLPYFQKGGVALSAIRQSSVSAAPPSITVVAEESGHTQLFSNLSNSYSEIPQEEYSFKITFEGDLGTSRPYVNHETPQLYYNGDVQSRVAFRYRQESQPVPDTYTKRVVSVESPKVLPDEACPDKGYCTRGLAKFALRRTESVLTSHASRAERALPGHGVKLVLSEDVNRSHLIESSSSFEATLSGSYTMEGTVDNIVSHSAPYVACGKGCAESDLSLADWNVLSSSVSTTLLSKPSVELESTLQSESSVPHQPAVAVPGIAVTLKNDFRSETTLTALEEARPVRPKPRPTMRADDLNQAVARVPDIDDVYASFDLSSATGAPSGNDGGFGRSALGVRATFVLVGVFSDGSGKWALVKDRSGRMHRVETSSRLGSVSVIHISSRGINIEVGDLVKRVSVGAAF